MTDLPDANAGGLDPHTGGLDPTGAAKPKLPMWKRIRAYAIIFALYAVILGMGLAAVPMLRSVFHGGVPLEDRGLNLMYAVFLLLPLAFVVRYFLRLRLKTGRWRGTPEYITRERAERRAKCSPAGGCGRPKSSWTHYAVHWATCNAMDRTLPMPQRIGAWAVLAVYAAWLLALTGIGLICFGAAVPDPRTTITASLLLIGIGIVVLIWPTMAVVKLVRGIRAGRVGATREDVEQIRAQRRARHQREWQKPLRSKIISTAISCVIVALWWMRVTVHRAQHSHESWAGPAIATVPLICSIWIQFRKPKNIDSPDGGSTTIDGS